MRTRLYQVVIPVLIVLAAHGSAKCFAQGGNTSDGGTTAVISAPASTAPLDSSTGGKSGATSASDGVGEVKRIGGAVSAPMVIKHVEPRFSDEARKAKLSGTVTINLIIDAHGLPQKVHVVRGVGMGLDEKALEAVKQYRFKPAMENGKPVAVSMNIEVQFQLFDKNGNVIP